MNLGLPYKGSKNAIAFDIVNAIPRGGKILDGVVRLKARIAELEEERRWRKCSDEMPEEDEEVLFSDGNLIYLGCWTSWDGGCSDYSYETYAGWIESGSEHDYDFNEIKYWMPLPSAPKEYK